MKNGPDLSRVDSDLRAVIGLLPDLSNLSEATLPSVRTAIAGVPAALGTDDAGVTVTRIELPGRDGAPTVSALLYEPPARSGGALRPVILDLHGGGYVAGTAQRDDRALRTFAATLGVVGLAPDYRLAPEHPHPAALDDAAASLRWLHAKAGELRLDVAKLAVRGVSAGGGLAVSLALREHAERRERIAHLHLLFPMLDDRTGDHAFNGQFVWTAGANRFGWSSLLRGHDRAAPPAWAVPARAKDVGGLPPTFMALGSIDLFASEDLVFSTRLVDAGVALELHVHPGAFHAFNLVADARCARALARDEIEALRRALCEQAPDNN
jgi:acetyl esterase/lipase